MVSVRSMYQKLPRPVRALLTPVLSRLPMTTASRHERWVRDVYTEFGNQQRRNIFLSIARFCHINRPMTGYYFEFGCHEANTMRMAHAAFRHLFDWTYVAFDSFEGLPDIGEIDKQEIWEKGKLNTSEERFRRIVLSAGIPKDKLVTVKGFYDRSLTEDLKKKLLPAKASVVYIDCDLYASTVPVLRFVKDFLQRGTVIVFDDWNCFHGDPSKGERRAFAEFREQNPDLVFQEFVQTNEAQSFIYLGRKNSGGDQ